MSTISRYCSYCRAPLAVRNGRCRNCHRLIIIDNRYRIDGTVGGGGFSTVYYAIDTFSGAACAVKLVSAQSDALYRMIESEIGVLTERLRGLRFVPRIYGAFQDGADVYIVMEYIPGRTLDRVRQKPWRYDSVQRFLDEMLNHLGTIHRNGVIHRDVKPQNILRNQQGAYFLIDFGIAKQGIATRTAARGAATFDYAPLEQLTSQTTSAQADLYSLGVVAYELLTGVLPPSAFDRLQGQAVTLPSQYDSSIPRRLERTIMHMIELQPQNRPPNAASALKMLRDAPPLIHAPPRRSGSGTSSGSAAAGFLVFLIIVSAIVAGGFAFFSQAPRQPQQDKIVGVPMGRIMFSAKNGASYDLFLADADGGPPWNLTASGDNEFAPAWSGNGAYVAYVAQIQNEYAIARLDLATRQTRLLAGPQPGVNFGTPVPSPDGRMIAFNSGPLSNLDLYIMNADGSAARPVAQGPGSDSSPAWMPDGQTLIYIAQQSGQWAIKRIGVDRTPGDTLYASPHEKRFLTISPQGDMLAFAMLRDANWDIYTLPIDGGEPQRVTSDPAEDLFPAWSPDGRSLMFMSTRLSSSVLSGATQLYVVPATGGPAQRVFADREDDRHPAWIGR